MLSDFLIRIRSLFRRNTVERELDDELRFHLDQQVEKFIQSGMSSQEAQRRARLMFGGTEEIKEECREARGVLFVENLLPDLRCGLRTMRKSPGFTAVVVLTLALGMGVNTALFTIVHGVLLSPLPFPRPDRLVSLWERNVVDNSPFSAFNVVSGGVFADWQQATSFQQMALIGENSANLSGDGGSLPESIGTRQCSYNLFSMLGVQPLYGRLFTEEDDRRGAAATVILTHSLWKRRYASDLAIVGKTILLDAVPYTVIGVLPAWFDYPDTRVQLWQTVNHEASVADMHNRGNHRFFVTARLKDGVSLAQADSELDAIQQRNHKQFPNELMGKGANVLPLSDNLVRDVKSSLYLLMGAVICVLVIACLNVANLFVARGTARRKEFAVRAALGGSRWRIIREQLTESLLLTFLGGTLGSLLAWSAIRWIVALRENLPRANSIHLDQTALIFTIAITTLSGLFAGLLPALAATRSELLGPLKENARSVAGGHTRARLRKILLTAEVALTVVLLVGGGLMLKSFAELRSVNIGCATENVLTMSFTLPDAKYPDLTRKAQFFDELLLRIRAMPGVSHAASVSVLPGDGHFFDNTFTIEGKPLLLPGQFQDAVIRGADPEYCATMNIPLLRGRYFTDQDKFENLNAMLITQSLVNKFFPNEDPLGKVLKIDWEGSPRFQIVGIVGDVFSNLDQPPEPAMYLPLNSGRFEYGSLVVRSSRDVTSLALPIQKQIASIDPDLAVTDVLTMEQIIGKNTANAMFDAALVLLFAVLALILAAVGLYGLLSYLVTQRTNEIGIRMALGAQRRGVMGAMLLDGLRPTAIGLVLGLVGGGLCSQLIRSLLFGVRPIEWTIFAGVALLVLLIAMCACAYPAWRATRVDPIVALRYE
jgi:putative ABC transport system permease protein